ncbi:MAG: hypothetical protein HDR23_02285 [Lachnospiraceae bacterium]|nr:hypothetical protein [Lachnospiraceae bacterium]
MSFTIYVRMKNSGKQKNEDLSPVPFVLDDKPQTVKDLLILLTKHGVKQYNTREEQAIKNTLQCFEDGIYRLFAGDRELTSLSEVIPWTEGLIFTFIRLTMLSGW